MIQYCCSRKYLISHVFIVLSGCQFCHHEFFSWFHCLAAVVVNLSSRGFTLLLSIFFSRGLTVFLSILFFSWFQCLLLGFQFCFSPGLAVFLLSILFSHDVGCFVFVNLLFSWYWVHYSRQILFFPCRSCESIGVLISSAFNLFPHWFCMLCATDQYLYVVAFLITIPGH
jgi:hypothetical protein